MTPSLGNSHDIEMVDMNALERGEGPRPQHDNSNGCCGVCYRGRIITTVVTTVDGLLIGGGTVAAVVGGFLQSIGWVAGGGISVAIGLGTHIAYSCYLTPKKNTEEILHDYQEENQRLKGEVVRLGQENGRLEKNIEHLRGIEQGLNRTLQEAKESTHELEEMLESKVESLQKIALKLKETEYKLQVLDELYVNLKKTTKSIAQDVTLFNRTNKVFESHVGDFGSGVSHLDKHEDDLSDEIDQYESANEFQRVQNERLMVLLGGLKDEFGVLGQRYLKMKEALEELKSQTIKLDEADDKFREGADTLDRMSERLEKLWRDIHEEQQQLSEHSFTHSDVSDTSLSLRSGKKKAKRKLHTEKPTVLVVPRSTSKDDVSGSQSQ